MSSIHHLTPTRPCWNHREVRLAVLSDIFPLLEDWCGRRGLIAENMEDPEGFSRDLRGALALALSDTSDAYAAARFLDEFAGLPADTELVQIMQGAFTEMSRAADRFVSAWVMKHRVRFKPKRESVIRFRVGDLHLTGTVAEIISRHAKALVAVRRGEKTDHIWVNAEEVIDDYGPTKKKVKGKTP